MVPELGRLVLVVPLELGVARREVALLGPRRVLVAADAGDQGVEAVGGRERLLQGDGLQLVGDRDRVRRLVADPALARLEVRPDDQLEAVVLLRPDPEVQHLGELVGRVDVDDGEGHVAAERLLGQPEEDVGVLAHRPEHRRLLEAVEGLAHQVDALRFEFVQVCHREVGQMFRGRVVQAALALEPEEAGLLGRHVGGERPGRVHVADRDVALLPERMVGQVVLGQVAVDVPVGPVDDRQDLRRGRPGVLTTGSCSRVLDWTRRRPASHALAPSSESARCIGSTFAIWL